MTIARPAYPSLPVTTRRTVLAAAGATLLAARAARAAENVRFVWGGDGLHFLLMHIATEGGFFVREGLTPDMINVPSGNLQVAAILGGSADLAPVGFTGVVQASSHGADIVAVANIFNVISLDLVLSKAAAKRAGITPDMPIDEKIKRLNGLRIGITTPGSGSDFLLRTMLRARGIDPDTALHIQPLGDGPTMVAALEKGSTDGFVWMSPFPEVAVAKGVGEIVINPFSREVPEINDVPYIVLATSPETLKNRGPIVSHTVAALQKAADFIRQKPAGTLELVRRAFPNVDPAILATALKVYVAGIPASLAITPAQVDKTITWMNMGSKTKLNVSYAQLVAPVPAL